MAAEARAVPSAAEERLLLSQEQLFPAAFIACVLLLAAAFRSRGAALLGRRLSLAVGATALLYCDVVGLWISALLYAMSWAIHCQAGEGGRKDGQLAHQPVRR